MKTLSKELKSPELPDSRTSTVPIPDLLEQGTVVTDLDYQPDSARLSAVIERLRPSKIESDEQLSVESVNDGRLWAEQQATAIELNRLDAAGGVYAAMWDVGPSAYSDAERFFFVICPEHRRKRKKAREFWTYSIGEWQMPTDHYVTGFISGAMDVWSVVKTRL